MNKMRKAVSVALLLLFFFCFNQGVNFSTSAHATDVVTAEVNARAEVSNEPLMTEVPDCTPKKVAAVNDPNDACTDFIVVFKSKYSRTSANNLIVSAGGRVRHTFNSVLNGALIHGQRRKMKELAKQANVLSIEENHKVVISAVQNPAPWGLDRIDQRQMPLDSSFDDGGYQGANTQSFVVDSGIDATNVDFEGRVLPGYTTIIDGLGSGDCHGHGTHVAGTIGSKNYGVAKKTTLIPVRVLDCTGSGYSSDVIDGLNWIATNHRAGDEAVVNMSLGGPASSALDDAVNNLISKGITVVVAAGNSNDNACNYSPARVPDAITVGAISYGDSRASYSSFGTCLDIFAPGTFITSTWLGTSGTATISGTSMASPHVAGIVSRFIGQYPGLTPAQVLASIKTSSTKNLVTSAGTGSPNQLAYLLVTPDIPNVSLSVAGSAKSVTSREPITLSAFTNVAGKVTFQVNGKPIPGCKGINTVSLTATCQWKSSVKGTNKLSAQVAPTETANKTVASSGTYAIDVVPRSGTRR